MFITHCVCKMSHNKLLNDLEVNYIMYSHIAAKIVRQCLKKQFQAEAKNREKSHIQIYKLEKKKKTLLESLVIGRSKKQQNEE